MPCRQARLPVTGVHADVMTVSATRVWQRTTPVKSAAPDSTWSTGDRTVSDDALVTLGTATWAVAQVTPVHTGRERSPSSSSTQTVAPTAGIARRAVGTGGRQASAHVAGTPASGDDTRRRPRAIGSSASSTTARKGPLLRGMTSSSVDPCPSLPPRGLPWPAPSCEPGDTASPVDGCPVACGLDGQAARDFGAPSAVL